jgi:cob(I)alamin adenosyltransferase
VRYYTKAGDSGQTQGLTGCCAKSDPQIEVFGVLDEAQVALGFAAVKAEECVQDSNIYEALRWMQQVLFDIGGTRRANDLSEMLARAESLCDEFTPDEKSMAFTLPGSTELSARIDLARVALRRYERKLCAISEKNKGALDAIPLINRLSDLTFALARHCD